MNSGCEGKICSGSLFHGEERRKEAVRLLPGSVWMEGFLLGLKRPSVI